MPRGGQGAERAHVLVCAQPCVGVEVQVPQGIHSPGQHVSPEARDTEDRQRPPQEPFRPCPLTWAPLVPHGADWNCVMLCLHNCPPALTGPTDHCGCSGAVGRQGRSMHTYARPLGGLRTGTKWPHGHTQALSSHTTYIWTGTTHTHTHHIHATYTAHTHHICTIHHTAGCVQSVSN